MSSRRSGKNLPIAGNPPTSRRKAIAAFVAGVSLLATTACSPKEAAPQEIVPTHLFQTKRAWEDLETIVEFGPRPAGSAAIERLRGFLETELRGAGLEPVREAFTTRTPIGDVNFVNVYADLPGTTPAASGPDAPIVVIGSHFDTKRLPFEFVGANDGGSSTAVLLELARQIAASERPRDVTYRFLFLDGEEAVRPDWEGTDNRYGSRHHVSERLESGEIQRIKVCVILDLVGDKDLQLTHDLKSVRPLLAIVWNAAQRLGLRQHVGARAKEIDDDHISFLEAGVPSVDLIDLEFGPYNTWWHTENDVLANCAPESLGIIGQIVLEALPEIEAFALAVN